MCVLEVKAPKSLHEANNFQSFVELCILYFVTFKNNYASTLLVEMKMVVTVKNSVTVAQ